MRARRQAERLADPQAAFDAYRRRTFTCRSEEDGSVVFEGRLPEPRLWLEMAAVALAAFALGALVFSRLRETVVEAV